GQGAGAVGRARAGGRRHAARLPGQVRRGGRLMARRSDTDRPRGGLTRRELLRGGSGAAGLAALGGLTAGARPAAAQGERRPPNVVLIVADRLRSDYVGAYDDVFDDRKPDTPNIDALADQSLRF